MAVEEEQVVGYAGLIAYPEEAHIATIGVTGGRQGEGIGARLLDTLLAEADTRSQVVLLEVRADNEPAQGAVPAPRVRRDRASSRLLPAQRHRRRGDEQGGAP